MSRPGVYAEQMHAFERWLLLCALADRGGVRAATARYLGLSRKSVWQKIREHGITDEEIAAFKSPEQMARELARSAAAIIRSALDGRTDGPPEAST